MYTLQCSGIKSARTMVSLFLHFCLCLNFIFVKGFFMVNFTISSVFNLFPHVFIYLFWVSLGWERDSSVPQGKSKVYKYKETYINIRIKDVVNSTMS